MDKLCAAVCGVCVSGTHSGAKSKKPGQNIKVPLFSIKFTIHRFLTSLITNLISKFPRTKRRIQSSVLFFLKVLGFT